jgi:hypothetical protein
MLPYAGEVKSLRTPRAMRVACGVRKTNVMQRFHEYEDESFCYIDVTSGSDRAELACRCSMYLLTDADGC